MRPKRDDPFGLLILAAPFVVGGIILLFQRGPSLVVASPAHYAPSHVAVEASEPMMHVIGAIGVIVGGWLVGLYTTIRKR
jgi:hypothetical protein